ncbi:hypothetical protein B14911_03344 [Bacillus sp. NRRL B-14911]|nr:hypothetical protein B14911_03344 [Bacillus sp. NRRL B-14911]
MAKWDFVDLNQTLYRHFSPSPNVGSGPALLHLLFQFIYEMYELHLSLYLILDRLLHRSEILTFSEEQDSIRMKYRKALFDNQSVES